MDGFQLQCNKIRQTLKAIHQKKDKLFGTIENYIEYITPPKNEWAETEEQTRLSLEDYKHNLAECMSSLAVKKNEISGGIFLAQQKHSPLMNKAEDANTKKNKIIRKYTKRRDNGSRSPDRLQKEFNQTEINTHEQISSLNENVDNLSERLDDFLQEYKLQRETDRLKIQELEEIVRGTKDKEQMENLNNSNNSISNTLQEMGNELYGLDARLMGLENKVEEVSCTITQLEIQQETQIKADEEFMKSLQEINIGLTDYEVGENMEIEDWFDGSNEGEAAFDIGENEPMVQGTDNHRGIPGNKNSERGTTQVLTGESDSAITNPDFDSVKITHGIEIIGFSACVPQDGLTKISQTCFCDVVSNFGNYYTPSSGRFSAPVDGVYLVSLTHKQGGENDILLKLIHETRTPNRDWQTFHIIGETWTSWQNTSSSFVIPLRMLKGDKLFLRPDSYNAQITSPSSFSCYLISL